ncbi:glycine betaine/L-proline ABC transporter substrate-binding protein ProX [Kaustia mangrovi]|uniref:Glycine betaine/L-proline ABC transporter substrate-binding protein ProX n=1 Tax=Kaustia mangrovi TaxID=2593653 RepID=A0A7S8C482_9HYPH|nr:glycine betaine/L-proline ABC transporter substrate-binding protein ProX [Kaustia mangrovi]QPC43067.1 glycine betaine/L-proline ABC transporter substrate-binding protein ProX [Kaustia mangrovi]
MWKFLTTSAAGIFAAAAIAGAAVAQDLPGDGKEVKLARASWDTGWFQAEIYKKALEELGYDIGTVTTLDNPAFYQSVAQGDMDLWVNGWFPLHNTYKDDFESGAEIVGYVAEGGALQGYLIDKKTAEEHGITNIADFKKEEIRSLFDDNGDGKAEMVACPPGWGCEKVIAHQLDAYGLRDYVEPIKAAYSASMADAIGRYEEGKPIFFYTWTPNWTVGVLKPGKDVVWIEVPEPSLPEDQKDLEDETTVEGVAGCVEDPCEMGWPANDIRPVANTEFLKENPAVKTLLEEMRIPIEDIFAQNAKMNAGEDKKADLERHAAEWIKAHRDEFDKWIEDAKAAAAN